MKIMVVSPHPDDETLGAGGTLLKLKKEGHMLSWLNITDMNPEYGWDEGYISKRKAQIENVIRFFGFDSFENLGYPTTRLKQMEEGKMIKRISEVFNRVRPDWIIIPGNYDAHSDHLVVFDSCMAAAKSFRAIYIKRIMAMEILSETDYGYRDSRFMPNLFVDITDELEGKIEAMKLYDTELEEQPFPRSTEGIKALATYRGGSCARKYAEAFQLIKQIE